MKTQWWDTHAGYLKPGEVDEAAELVSEIGVEASEENVAANVARITRELWADQGKGRQKRQSQSTEVYYGCDWSGGDDNDAADRDALSGVGISATPSGYNVIQSITDTSVSRLVQNRIRPL